MNWSQLDNQLTPGYFKLSHADSFNERHQVIERLRQVCRKESKVTVDYIEGGNNKEMLF